MEEFKTGFARACAFVGQVAVAGLQARAAEEKARELEADAELLRRAGGSAAGVALLREAADDARRGGPRPREAGGTGSEEDRRRLVSRLSAAASTIEGAPSNWRLLFSDEKKEVTSASMTEGFLVGTVTVTGSKEFAKPVAFTRRYDIREI